MENQKIYNPLNLPAGIYPVESCDHSHDFQSITYVYSIDGVKLQQIVTPVDGQTTSTDYYGPMVLNDGELKKIRHSYGQMREIDGDFEPVFHIADHGSTALTINLGSPRVIFWDEDGDGVVREDEVLERIDYYPFGLEHGRPVDHPEDMESHFRYTDQEHGPAGMPYYDYVSRLYDPALGRFLGVDDLAGHIKQLGMSPYSAMWNNPLRWNDPDGRCPVCPTDAEMGDLYYWGGSEFKFDGDAWFHNLPELVVRPFDHDHTNISDPYSMEGVIFYMDGGRGQETRRGYGDFVDAGPLLSTASLVGAAGRAHPRNRFGDIISKFGNVFTAWETGHELGNMYDISPARDEVPADPFDRRLPVYMQTSRETRRMAIDQYRDSPLYEINTLTPGENFSPQVIGDTILTIRDSRDSINPRKRRIGIGGPPVLK
jgi:RHS repeat-associated protein